MAVKARLRLQVSMRRLQRPFNLRELKHPFQPPLSLPVCTPCGSRERTLERDIIYSTWQIGYVECVRHVRALSPTRNALNKSKLSDYRMRCLPGWRHVCFVYLVKRHCRLHCSAFVEPQANNREKEQERPHQELPARVADGALPLLIVLFADNHSSVGAWSIQ